MNDDSDFMELAITEMRKCNPPNPAETPRVGAVVVIGQRYWTAHRGDEDHAEKLALAQIPHDQDFSEAVVYTTLEPCTQHARRVIGESCTERLTRKSVKKVVIGILDPNQDICGRGLSQLQAHGIEVSLFPHDLAQRIRQHNDEFIQAQQNLGIKITSPESGSGQPAGVCRVSGTFENVPGRNVVAITQIGNLWWPQPYPISIEPDQDNRWHTDVHFGAPGPIKIHVVRVNDLGMALINYYGNMVYMRGQIIEGIVETYGATSLQARAITGMHFWPIVMERLHKGLNLEASIEINVI